MYAIIAASGRQYKVVEGQELQIDYRVDAKPGDSRLVRSRRGLQRRFQPEIRRTDLVRRQRDGQSRGGRRGPEDRDPKIPPSQNDAPSHRPSANADPREDRQDHARLGSPAIARSAFEPALPLSARLPGQLAGRVRRARRALSRTRIGSSSAPAARLRQVPCDLRLQPAARLIQLYRPSGCQPSPVSRRAAVAGPNRRAHKRGRVAPPGGSNRRFCRRR